MMKFIRRFCSRRFSPDPHQLPAAGVFTPKAPSKILRFSGVALMSNRYNHHLAGRTKQQTRPAAAVFGRPGEFGARSRWVCKLASSARSTPREGAKHKKTGGRWSAATGRTPATTRKRQASKNDARHPKQRAHLLDTCKCTISGFSSVWIRPFIGVAHMVWLLFAVVQD